MIWSLLIGHQETVRVSWVGLRPRIEVEGCGGRRTYRPKVSGHLVLGPLTSDGRLLTFGRGP